MLWGCCWAVCLLAPHLCRVHSRVLARQGSGAGRAVTRRFFCDSVLFGAVLPTVGSVGSHSELLMRFAINETRDACFFVVVHSR